MAPIRIAIVGYGNLGRSVEKLTAQQPDVELAGIFSRRDSLDTDAPVWPVAEFASYTDQFDVAVLCLGSATDIPEQAPEFIRHANTVDTYDNHRDVPRHRAAMDKVAKENGTVAVVSTGWDPGMFSLNRTIGQALLPGGQQQTFWGPGLSQGHSDAVRRVPGVKKGVQYTKPNPDAIAAVKRGEGGDLDAKKCHIRHCYIVADEADQDAIREAIVTMPDYFVGYETIVDFISDEEFERDHQGMPHGGNVVTQGRAGTSRHVIEFGLELERNPDFTAAVQVAYGRAAHRLREAGERGARTVLEIAPYLLSQTPLDELIKNDV